MTEKIKVKFLVGGKHADVPGEPIFEVDEGEVKEVTIWKAELLVDAGKAEYVNKADQEPVETEQVEPSSDDQGDVQSSNENESGLPDNENVEISKTTGKPKRKYKKRSTKKNPAAADKEKAESN
jgi:hypothetical protein